MDPEKRREIARRGGQTAQSLGKAHRFTQEEARQAGAKGGRALSRNRAHMAEIGRRGRAIQQRRRTEASNPHTKEQ
jgi:general stress protein YciG